jgi:glycosyltransferase involved in cell wall biosynthesis
LLEGGFGISGLVRLGRELDALPGPYRILVQYVPHAYGWKAMNLPFCLFLWTRRGTPVWVMFHEIVVALTRSQPLHHNVLGLVTRLMAAIVLRSAEKVFTGTLAWERVIRQLAPANKPVVWTPVPSNVETEVDPSLVAALRKKLAGPNAVFIGHFGTYGPYNRSVLKEIVPALLKRDILRIFVLLGRDGQAFAREIGSSDPSVRDRIIAPDGLPARELSSYLAACDVVVQPYPSGITARSGSAMAALALGVPIVTNEGLLSESLWRDKGVVMLLSENSPESFVHATEELLCAPEIRTAFSAASRSFYQAHFSIERTLSRLNDHSCGLL